MVLDPLRSRLGEMWGTDGQYSPELWDKNEAILTRNWKERKNVDSTSVSKICPFLQAQAPINNNLKFRDKHFYLVSHRWNCIILSYLFLKQAYGPAQHPFIKSNTYYCTWHCQLKYTWSQCGPSCPGILAMGVAEGCLPGCCSVFNSPLLTRDIWVLLWLCGMPARRWSWQSHHWLD